MAGRKFTRQSNLDHPLLAIEAEIEISRIQTRHTASARGTVRVQFSESSRLSASLSRKLQYPKKRCCGPRSPPTPAAFAGTRYSLILSPCISHSGMHLRRSVGRSIHIRLVDRSSFLSTSHILPDDFPLYLICLIQALQYLRSVAEVSPISDIFLSLIPFLIIDHLGFFSAALLLAFDSGPRWTADSLLVCDDYPNFRNRHSNRSLPNPHFDSATDSFVSKGNNHYLRSGKISLISFSSITPSPVIGHIGPACGLIISCLLLFSFLSSCTIFPCPFVDIRCRIFPWSV